MKVTLHENKVVVEFSDRITHVPTDHLQVIDARDDNERFLMSRYLGKKRWAFENAHEIKEVT